MHFCIFGCWVCGLWAVAQKQSWWDSNLKKNENKQWLKWECDETWSYEVAIKTLKNVNVHLNVLNLWTQQKLPAGNWACLFWPPSLVRVLQSTGCLNHHDTGTCCCQNLLEILIRSEVTRKKQFYFSGSLKRFTVVHLYSKSSSGDECQF